jgi:CRISPR/Cas system CSM-associated protein Csm2 small subunit
MQLIAEMNASQERQLIGVRAQFDAKVELDRVKIDELIKEARTTHENLQARETVIAKLQPLSVQLAAELERAKIEINSLGQEILSVRRECMDTVNKHSEELADQYRKQTETLMSGYQVQINRINAETEKRIAMLQQQQRIFEEELTAAEERFRQRPSREEDVSRITELELQVSRQIEQIRSLLSDHLHSLFITCSSLSAYNQRLGLEVASREQSFNMMFKQTPTVGTLNPLTPGKVAATQAKSTPGTRLQPISSTPVNSAGSTRK